LLHVEDLDHDALVFGGFVYGALHLEVTLVDTFGGFGVKFVGDLDKALEVDLWRLMMLCCDLDEA
jgi:hypothetical protein